MSTSIRYEWSLTITMARSAEWMQWQFFSETFWTEKKTNSTDKYGWTKQVIAIE